MGQYNISKISIMNFGAAAICSIAGTVFIVMCANIVKKFDGAYAPMRSWRNLTYLILSILFTSILFSALFFQTIHHFRLSPVTNDIYSKISISSLNSFASCLSVFLMSCFFIRPTLRFKLSTSLEKLIYSSIGLTLFAFVIANHIFQFNIPIILFVVLFSLLIFISSVRLCQRCSYFVSTLMIMSCLMVNTLNFNPVNYSIVDFYIPIYMSLAIILETAFFTLAYKVKNKLDIIESKLNKKQKAIESKSRELEKLSGSKGLFLSTVGHELKTPLNSIVGMISMIDFSNQNKQISDIKAIKDSIFKLNDTISSLLELSAMEFLTFNLQEKEFNVSAFIEDIIDHLNITVRREKASIEFITEELPGLIKADEDRMKKVVYNIIDYILENTTNSSILFSVTSDIDSIDFSIHVSESGNYAFKTDDLIYPFSKKSYFDSHSSYPSLSSAIIGRLIERMGGTLDITSTSDGGYFFQFKIPINVISNDLDTPIKDKDIYIKKGIHHSDNPIILVVDDSVDDRKFLKLVLSKYRCHLIEAKNGHEAIKIYQKLQSDLVIMDINMPVMDGIETTKQLRKIEKDHLIDSIPIIGVTAYSNLKGIEDACANLFDYFMEKPIDRDKLIKNVLNILDLKEL